MLTPFALTASACTHGQRLHSQPAIALTASAHSSVLPARTRIRKLSFQSHIPDFITRPALPGCCLSSDSVKRQCEATQPVRILCQTALPGSKPVFTMCEVQDPVTGRLNIPVRPNILCKLLDSRPKTAGCHHEFQSSLCRSPHSHPLPLWNTAPETTPNCH